MWREKTDFLADGSLKIHLDIPFVIRPGFGAACEQSRQRICLTEFTSFASFFIPLPG